MKKDVVNHHPVSSKSILNAKQDLSKGEQKLSQTCLKCVVWAFIFTKMLFSVQALSAHAYRCGVHMGERHRRSPAEGAECGQRSAGGGTKGSEVAVATPHKFQGACLFAETVSNAKLIFLQTSLCHLNRISRYISMFIAFVLIKYFWQIISITFLRIRVFLN